MKQWNDGQNILTCTTENKFLRIGTNMNLYLMNNMFRFTIRNPTDENIKTQWNIFSIVIALKKRVAMFSKTLFQHCSIDIQASFIGHQKTVDRIKHNGMIKILEETGLGKTVPRINANLHNENTNSIRNTMRHI